MAKLSNGLHIDTVSPAANHDQSNQPLDYRFTTNTFPPFIRPRANGQAPNRGAQQAKQAGGERSDQPGDAPRLGAGAEGEVARLRRHRGRHRAAAAPVRRRRWGRRDKRGARARRRGIGFIWGGKLAVGKSARTRWKGRRGAGGEEAKG